MQRVKAEKQSHVAPQPVQQVLLPVRSEDLEVIRSSKRVAVFCRGFCFCTYDFNDRFSRNYCLVQLHVAGGVKLRDLSQLFGLSYQHCSNVVVRYRQGGVEGLLEKTAKRFGNRRKIDEKIGVFVLKLRGEGISYREISHRIRFRFKKRIKMQSLRVWVSRHHQGERKIEEQLTFSDDLVSENRVVQEPRAWHWNSYAGSMILYGMIDWSGFLKPFEEHILEEPDKRQSRWGVRRVLLTLFFLHALRCRSIEQGKHLVGEDFREVVGGEFLRGQWLRTGVDELVEHDGFDQAMASYYQDLIRLTDRRDGIYYTDGHFSTYYGKQKVPKGWDPRRQMGFKGRNTIYLHNSQGEIVYLFESPANTSLSKDILALSEDLEGLGMSLKGKTLIFDRGGYAKNCFRHLKQDKKMYFATYLKHRKKERLLAAEVFQKICLQTEDGEEVTYQVFEKERRDTRYGQVRVVVFLAEDGRQIPIITNNPYLKMGRVVYLLQCRWREENCFKYMREHFGLDLLTTYQTEAAPDWVVKRANPERQAVNREIQKKKNELERLQKELGKRVAQKEEQSHEPLSRFLEAERELRFAIKNIEVDLDVLKRKRQSIATKVEVNLKDEHVIIAQKRRLLINAVKAMNYNCEKWLQIEFKKVHAKKDETLSLIRSLWRQPGRICQQGRWVEVKLRGLDRTSMKKSLDQVLKKLKENNRLRLPDGRSLKISQGA